MARLSGWKFLDSDVDFLGQRLITNLPRGLTGASPGAEEEPTEENCGTGAGGFAKGNKCAKGGGGMRAGRETSPSAARMKEGAEEYAKGKIKEIEGKVGKVGKALPARRELTRPLESETVYDAPEESDYRPETERKQGKASTPVRGSGRARYGLSPDELKRLEIQEKADLAEEKRREYAEKHREQTELEETYGAEKKAEARKRFFDTSMGQIAKDVGGVAGAALSAAGGAIKVGVKGFTRGMRFLYDRYGDMGSLATIGVVGGVAALTLGAPAFGAAYGAAKAAALGPAIASGLGTVGAKIGAVTGANAIATGAGFKAALAAGAASGAMIGVVAAEARNLMKGVIAFGTGHREAAAYQFQKGFVPGVKDPDAKTRFLGYKLGTNSLTTNQVPPGLAEDVYKFLTRLCQMMKIPPLNLDVETIEAMLAEQYEKLEEEGLGDGESPPDPSIEGVSRESAPMSAPEPEPDYFSRRPVKNSQPSDELEMSSEKACEIMRDGSVHGKKLTKAQKGMFGAKCGERTNNEDNWEDYAVNARMCWGKPCPGAGGMPAAKPDSGGSGSVEASVDRAHFYAKARGQAHREKGSSEPGYKDLERRKRRLRASDPRRTLNEMGSDGWVFL